MHSHYQYSFYHAIQPICAQCIHCTELRPTNIVYGALFHTQLLIETLLALRPNSNNASPAARNALSAAPPKAFVWELLVAIGSLTEDVTFATNEYFVLLSGVEKLSCL